MHKQMKSNSESDLLRHALKVSGSDAYRTALSKGVAVTVLEGENIQRIQPDGKKITLGKINKVNRKVLPARIRVK
jgi:hypothetical protein